MLAYWLQIAVVSGAGAAPISAERSPPDSADPALDSGAHAIDSEELRRWVHFSWQAPDTCPDRTAVSESIRRLFAVDPKLKSKIRVDARVTKQGDGYRLQLLASDMTFGAALDSPAQTRILSDPDCGALAEAVALVVVLALAAGSSAALEGLGPSAPPRDTREPAAPSRSVFSSQIAMRLGFQPFAGPIEPAWTLGAGVEAEQRLSVWLLAEYWPGLAPQREAAIEIDFTAYAVLAPLCYTGLLPIAFRGCLGPAAGIARAASTGAPRDDSVSAPWYAGFARASLLPELGPSTRLLIDGEVRYTPKPPAFALHATDSTLLTLPEWLFSIGFGAEVEL